MLKSISQSNFNRGKRACILATLFASAAVLCHGQSYTQLGGVVPVVSTSGASGPIVITHGGTYSGKWNSNDPTKPAVTIITNQPVLLENSQVTGKGDLIYINGGSSTANVQIHNVTGVALDPKVKNVQRGHFVFAVKTSSLVIDHCTAVGVSFGVFLGGSTVTKLQITNNEGINLDDRASDGNGGLLPNRPLLGHFVILNTVNAPSGAEIAWNQVTQTIGSSSTEDVFNIYQSVGSAAHPIWIHDNYMEGYSSVGGSPAFGGNGIITDGSKSGQRTAFTLIESNHMVHAAGGGVAIDDGHDNLASGNRVVNCGRTVGGMWFAQSWAQGIHMWDYYGDGPTGFYNNRIVSTAGGLVRPNIYKNNAPMIADLWAPSPSNTYPGNSVTASDNNFTDPCMVNGTLNLGAEAAERKLWNTTLAQTHELVGDQHPLN